MRASNQHPHIYFTENRLFGEYHDVVPNADGTRSVRVTLDEYVRLLTQHYDFRAMGLDSAQFTDRMTAALAGAVLDFSFRASSKPVVVDKITPYRDTTPVVLEQIMRYFPDALLVQLVRDGRDVLTSGVFDWIGRTKKDHPRHDLFVAGKNGAHLDRFFDDEDIDQWAAEWTGPIRAFHALGQDVPLIRYEEMKRAQAEVLKGFFDCLGVDSSESILRHCVEESSFKKMSGGRVAGEGVATAKARKGVAGDWKNYFTRRDGELFHELAGDCMQLMGYEQDGTWVGDLPEKLHLTAEAPV